MRKQSVLFLNRVYPPVNGASGRVLRDLARAMAREGWQVNVITTGPKAITERDGSVRVIRVKGKDQPNGFWGYALIWIRMFIAALRFPPTDLIVTQTDPPLLVLAGAVLRRVKKAKHIHWSQDIYPDLFRAVNTRVPKFFQRIIGAQVYRAMRGCDKVIVVGRCMAKHLGMRGVPPKKMAVVPNWPDPELSVFGGKNGFNGVVHHGDMEVALKKGGRINSYRVHADQKKGGPKFRVLYAGNVGKAHPVDTILQAAEILHDDYPEIEFVFVGDGPRFDEIAQTRSRRHLDNVKLLPYQPANRLRELMESGDLHLVSMKHEALGMLVPSKLYSALAVARPSIFVGPRDSECAKVIHDYHAGHVVAQDRPEILAARIRDFRLDSDMWFAAQNGAKKAGEIFTLKASLHAWIERAQRVVDGEGSGPRKEGHDASRMNQGDTQASNHAYFGDVAA